MKKPGISCRNLVYRKRNDLRESISYLNKKGHLSADTNQLLYYRIYADVREILDDLIYKGSVA